MQTTRLFVGIPIQEEIIKKIHQLRFICKDKEGIRWVPDDNLHITTCFLGNIKNDKINNIVSLLEQFLSEKNEFKLFFDRLQLSPKRKPYMIWVRFKQNENFSDLSLSMIKIFNQEINKIKNPIPHITLARFTKKTNINEINLPDNLPDFEMNVRRVVLYKSVLKPCGSLYYPIIEVRLKLK